MKLVEQIFIRLTEIWHLHVDIQTIRTTGEQPFDTHEKGWTLAQELTSDDWILTASGDWKKVDEIFFTGELETVYNLRVADHHTYFVGDEEWGWSLWAHNTACLEQAAANDVNATVATYFGNAQPPDNSYVHLANPSVGMGLFSWQTLFNPGIESGTGGGISFNRSSDIKNLSISAWIKRADISNAGSGGPGQKYIAVVLPSNSLYGQIAPYNNQFTFPTTPEYRSIGIEYFPVDRVRLVPKKNTP